MLDSLDSMLSLFLASTCAMCDRPSRQQTCRCVDLCVDCQQQLQDCRWSSESSAAPLPEGLPVISWGKYEGGVKRAIARFKYDGQRELAEPLGLWLAECWLASELGHLGTQHPPLVVPIPLHPEKQRQRGFNQAELIAASFCRRARLPLARAGLVRTRATAPQFSLSPQHRQRNLHQAFALGPDLQPRFWPSFRFPNSFSQPSPSHRKPLLLLDDIYTTGATIQAARTVLEAAGWIVSGVVVVSRVVTSDVVTHDLGTNSVVTNSLATSAHKRRAPRLQPLAPRAAASHWGKSPKPPHQRQTPAPDRDP